MYVYGMWEESVVPGENPHGEKPRRQLHTERPEPELNHAPPSCVADVLYGRPPCRPHSIYFVEMMMLYKLPFTKYQSLRITKRWQNYIETFFNKNQTRQLFLVILDVNWTKTIVYQDNGESSVF